MIVAGIKENTRLTVCAIIQARMGSERLPGKVLMEIEGKPILEHIIDRLQTSKMVNSIIVATTSKKKDKPIVRLAEKCCVDYFIGSEEDVLERYVKAAEKSGANTIIRVTSDNPLIDITSLDYMIKVHIDEQLDYTFNVNDSGRHVYSDGIVIGLGTEVVSAVALKKACVLAKEGYQREHVTIFIEEHPELFKIRHIGAPRALQNSKLRLTVDTVEDLELMRKIYSKFYKRTKFVDCIKAIKFLEENGALLKINSHIKQKGLPK